MFLWRGEDIPVYYWLGNRILKVLSCPPESWRNDRLKHQEIPQADIAINGVQAAI